ncbi:hypothetical protein ABK040_013816 [Willaertia magna]
MDYLPKEVIASVFSFIDNFENHGKYQTEERKLFYVAIVNLSLVNKRMRQNIYGNEFIFYNFNFKIQDFLFYLFPNYLNNLTNFNISFVTHCPINFSNYGAKSSFYLEEDFNELFFQFILKFCCPLEMVKNLTLFKPFNCELICTKIVNLFKNLEIISFYDNFNLCEEKGCTISHQLTILEKSIVKFKDYKLSSVYVEGDYRVFILFLIRFCKYLKSIVYKEIKSISIYQQLIFIQDLKDILEKENIIVPNLEIYKTNIHCLPISLQLKLFNLENVKILSLKNIKESFNFNLLNNCKQLECLSLSFSNDIVVKGNFVNLKKLSLRNITSISNLTVEELITPNLEYLKIKKFNIILNKLNAFPKLTTLKKIDCDYNNYKYWFTFNNLKEYYSDKFINDSILINNLGQLRNFTLANSVLVFRDFKGVQNVELSTNSLIISNVEIHHAKISSLKQLQILNSNINILQLTNIPCKLKLTSLPLIELHCEILIDNVNSLIDCIKEIPLQQRILQKLKLTFSNIMINQELLKKLINLFFTINFIEFHININPITMISEFYACQIDTIFVKSKQENDCSVIEVFDGNMTEIKSNSVDAFKLSIENALKLKEINLNNTNLISLQLNGNYPKLEIINILNLNEKFIFKATQNQQFTKLQQIYLVNCKFVEIDIECLLKLKILQLDQCDFIKLYSNNFLQHEHLTVLKLSRVNELNINITNLIANNLRIIEIKQIINLIEGFLFNIKTSNNLIVNILQYEKTKKQSCNFQ